MLRLAYLLLAISPNFSVWTISSKGNLPPLDKFQKCVNISSHRFSTAINLVATHMPIEQIITLLSSLSILATPTTLPVSGYTLTEVRLVYPPSEDNPKGLTQTVIIKYYDDTKPQIKEEAKIEKVEEVKAKIPEAPAISNDYYSQMKYWCNFYGCNPDTLYRVMMCESGGNPKAYNPSGASGILQFLPSTFRHYSAKAGITNGNIWNASHQIQTGALMFSIGEARQWTCK